jgi:hypothetical protein
MTSKVEAKPLSAPVTLKVTSCALVTSFRP